MSARGRGAGSDDRADVRGRDDRDGCADARGRAGGGLRDGGGADGRDGAADGRGGAADLRAANRAAGGDTPADANPVFALMRAVMLYTLMLLAGIALGGMIVGWAAFGLAGVWAVLLALAALALYELPTQIVFAALALARPKPDDHAIAVGVSWLVKIGLLIGLFILLQDQTWFHHALFAALVVLGAVGVLAIEVWQVVRCRVPYVDPPAPRAS